MGKQEKQQLREMSKEEKREIEARAMSAWTGDKLTAPIIAIIALSVLGILVYVYLILTGIGTKTLLSFFPLAMYVLMYVSIITYAIDFFYRGKEASITDMLTRFCTLTAASVITTTDISNELIIIYVLILVFVPLMRESLTDVKKCSILSVLIAIMCIGAFMIRLADAIPVLNSLSGFALVAQVFDIINPTLQWLIFTALYFLRSKKEYELIEAILVEQNATDVDARAETSEDIKNAEAN